MGYPSARPSWARGLTLKRNKLTGWARLVNMPKLQQYNSHTGDFQNQGWKGFFRG